MLAELKTKLEAVMNNFPGPALELVDVRTKTSGRRLVIQIFLDKPGGISLDDLTSANRFISKVLDEWEQIAGPYLLEVSSAGVERPLTKLEHFRRFTGKRVKVCLLVPEGRRTIVGRIRGVAGQVITVDTDSGPVAVSHDTIAKANLVFEM